MTTVETFAGLAARVLDRPPRLGPVRLVAVDGPAGAGKSTFAARLAQALRAAGADTAEIHTDDLLDGWDDMLTFWPRFDRDVLVPLRDKQPGAYRCYDWHAGRFAGTVPVPVPDVLVVEGVTSARAVIRPELTLAVFVTAPRELRLARALRRDGAGIEAELRRWFDTEAAHFAADRIADHADLLVDGAPGVQLDPGGQYVRKVWA
ncbi:uridine kinase family protein [Planosporangium sp. 12N6]|uniref:uridine kinase family protein n=1 Tax=Planosporangium spinosum TaxID=3402278 RepID=UPI003CF28469